MQASVALPAVPGPTAKLGRPVTRYAQGCETTIVSVFARSHPELRVRRSRMKVDAAGLDRGSFMLLWHNVATEFGGRDIEIARVLEGMLGTDFKSARDLQLTYTRLFRGSTYKAFRREWLAHRAEGKSFSTEFTLWLLEPAFSSSSRAQACVAKEQRQVTARNLVRHRARVESDTPCAPSCGCDNVIRGDLVHVRKTKSTGRGLFARAFVPRDTWVAAYRGDVVLLTEVPDAKRGDYFLEFNDGIHGVDGRGMKTVGQVANHSCERFNAELVQSAARLEMNVRTLVDVQAGEEILVHYGTKYLLDPCWCATCKGRKRFGPPVRR